MADGASRKMAQGWLQERRWEDHQETEIKPKGKQKTDRRELQAELRSLEKLQSKVPNKALANDIERLKARLNGDQQPVKSRGFNSLVQQVG